jgi:tetratricopeptide (TPR) repeat protein
MAEARVVCALTAAGESWDIDAVRPVLAAAVADLKKWSPDGAPAHPIAAMGEPMLALYERDPERTFAIFDRYSRSEDPWVRAAAPLLRGTFGIMLGRIEGTESECQAALVAFRALGEAWGTAAVLMQLADFAKLRGDYEAAIAALEEGASLGQELGAWGDLSHIAGKLALIQLRAGDLTAARANLERAERGDSERSVGRSDAAVWLGLVRAELHFREGDTAAAARVCAEQLAWLEGKQSAWWYGLRAVIKARLALAVLADGDKDQCRALLTDALRTASDWVELPALADVIDAIAVLAQESPQLAATLLGAAHSVRGCFDEGSLDAPAARDSVRTRLGPDGFDAAYGRGRAMSQDDAVALAASAVANPLRPGDQLSRPVPARSGAGRRGRPAGRTR